MGSRTVRVVVTGATGQVAYALLPRIAAGEMFGPETEVDLRLADIPQMIDKAKGVVMELEDGAYPLLSQVTASADRRETHKDVDWALLVGSVPRGPGMERGDLIRKNGPIFVDEGRAIAEHGAPDVRVVVVGNPCNTNCLIARHAAGSGVPDDRWTALTRLDQNRARSLLAAKAGARVRDVRKLVIWGNHSATLYPDFTNALVAGRKSTDVVDRGWLETDFIAAVQQRGAAVIAARGASSAFSAAQAVVDHVRSLMTPTATDDWASVAVISDGSYDVPEGLVSSFPIRVAGDGWWEVVRGTQLDAFARARLAASVAELEKERTIVQDLLTGAAAH
jgi:malate dehydrogenase